MNTETECIAYLYKLKWPNGFVCPECRHSRAYTIATRRLPLYECANCHYQASLTTDTVMEGSRTSLVKWFAAIRLMSSIEESISAMSLSRLLAVTYKTAWSMCHRIRAAMAQYELSAPLEGQVALHDAAYACSLHYGTIISHARETRLLVGASVTEAGEPERMTIQTVKQEHLSGTSVLKRGIERFQETRMAWDAVLAFSPLHRYIPPKNKKTMPLVKKARHWLNDTFHGIGKKYLESYLLEFCCRVNLAWAGASLFPAISRICAGVGPSSPMSNPNAA